MPVRVTVAGESNIRELAMRFAAAGSPAGLRREIRTRMRAEGHDARDEVKDAIRALPIVGHRILGARHPYDGPRGRRKWLRAKVARAVRMKMFTVGDSVRIRIYIDRSRLGKYRALPRLMNGAPRWRHPVFGNRHAWAQNTSPEFWEPTLRPTLPFFEHAVEESVNTTMRML